MQWVLNFCRTLKIPTLESWQKFKIIFLKKFQPCKIVKLWQVRLEKSQTIRDFTVSRPTFPYLAALWKLELVVIRNRLGWWSFPTRSRFVRWSAVVLNIWKLKLILSMMSGIEWRPFGFFLTYPRGGEIWLIGKQRNPWSSGILRAFYNQT